MDYKNNIKNRIISDISNDIEVEDDVLKNIIDNHLDEYIYNNSPIKIKEKIEIRKSIYNSLKRLDILTELIDDKNVKEIMINSFDEIYIDKFGKYIKWDKEFESEEQLYNIIQQIVSKVNRIVNVSNPIVDARLYDGSRVNIVIPPIALKGPCMTIRKFPEKINMDKLIKYQSLDKNTADFLSNLVKNGYNIFISGGTGSGKTTFLNALSEFIPEDDRVITIEDSAELNISHVKNLVSLETRNKNIEGLGEIDMSMLIKASLRMNPDRIIVGEVRGKEALDMLQAMKM